MTHYLIYIFSFLSQDAYISVIEKSGYRPNLKKAGDTPQLVPHQSWKGWELMCAILPIEGDNQPFIMRQAVKMVVAADESNLTGGHVDWAAVEATLEAITTDTMPEDQFPTTQEEEEMFNPAVQLAPLAVILYHEVSQPKTKKRGGHRGKNKHKKAAPIYSYAVALPGQSADDAEWMTEEELIRAFPETWKLILVDFKKKGGEVGIDLGSIEEEEEVVVQEEKEEQKDKEAVETLEEEAPLEVKKQPSARKGRPPKIKPQLEQQELKSAAAVKAVPQLPEPSKQKPSKVVVAPPPLVAVAPQKPAAAPSQVGGVSLQTFKKQLDHMHSPVKPTRQQQPLSAPPAERPARLAPQQQQLQQRRVSEAPPPGQSLLTSKNHAQVTGQLRALSLKKLPNSPGYAQGANLGSSIRRLEGMTSASSCQRPIIEVNGVRVKYTVMGHLASLDMFHWKPSTKAVLEEFKLKEADEMARGYAAYKKIAQQSVSVEKKETPMAGGGRHKRKERSPPPGVVVVPLSDDDVVIQIDDDDDHLPQQPANKKQKVQREQQQPKHEQQHKPRRSARLAPEEKEEEEEEEEFVDAQEEIVEVVDIAIKEEARNLQRLTRVQAAAGEEEEEENKKKIMKSNNTRQTRSKAAEMEEDEEVEEEEGEEENVKKFLITEEHIVNPELWDSARITGAIHKDDELFVFIKWGVDGHTDIVDSARLMGNDRPHSMRALIEFYESRSRKKKVMKKRRQQRRRRQDAEEEEEEEESSE